MTRKVFHAAVGDRTWDAVVTRDGDELIVVVDDRTFRIRDLGGGELLVDDGATRSRLLTASTKEGVLVGGDGTWHVHRRRPGVDGGDEATAADGDLRAPMTGRVVTVEVQPGNSVEADAPCVVVEAMKMEHALRAPFDGTVETVACSVGDQVELGDLLVRVVPPEDTP